MHPSTIIACAGCPHGCQVPRVLVRGPRIVAVVCAIVFALAGCAGTKASTSATPTATAHPTLPTAATTPTIASSPLPVFSDWRAAYLGADGNLHAVSLDGKTDVAGPQLEGLNPTYLANTSGFSPNGHLMAYANETDPYLLSVGQGQISDVPISAVLVNSMYWSQDGSSLAISDGAGDFGLVRPENAAFTPLPNAPTPLPGATGTWQMFTLLGWVDSTDWAVTYGHPNNNPPTSVPTMWMGIYDLSTHALRPVVTFSSAAQGDGYWSLSPDGAHAIFYNRPYRADPYTPQVDEIDMATGAVTFLPNISQTMGSDYGFTGVAWRPGTNTLAASTGFTENGNVKTWLVDLGADSMTPITPTGFPVGWAPNNGPLVLSSGWQSEVGLGPYTLTAVTCESAAQCSATTLTKNAMTFTFLGFVRTA